MVKALGGMVAGVLAVFVGRYWLLPRVWKARTTTGSNQDECVRRAPRQTGPIIRIELTDDGEFRDRCQLTDVMNKLGENDDKLIVLYVHGWKHNASPDDTDFVRFGHLVTRLAQTQKRISGSEDGTHENGEKKAATRDVVGIYVGWDGAVGPDNSVLRNLTFWNRKRAADRISQSAVLSKILGAIENRRRQAAPNAEDVTILIGHSFGARILYAATSQVLLHNTQLAHPGKINSSYNPIEGPADLILLLNPAFEASMFTAMDSIRRPKAKWWEGVSDDQEPLLLVVSTENDEATKRYFPRGQRLEFARLPRQETALGHYDPYVTHTLKVSDGHRTNRPARQHWYDRFDAAGLRLELKDGVQQEGNPYLVATTTADVIDGHNGDPTTGMGIWTDLLVDWLDQLIVKIGGPAK